MKKNFILVLLLPSILLCNFNLNAQRFFGSRSILGFAVLENGLIEPQYFHPITVLTNYPNYRSEVVEMKNDTALNWKTYKKYVDLNSPDCSQHLSTSIFYADTSYQNLVLSYKDSFIYTNQRLDQITNYYFGNARPLITGYQKFFYGNSNSNPDSTYQFTTFFDLDSSKTYNTIKVIHYEYNKDNFVTLDVINGVSRNRYLYNGLNQLKEIISDSFINNTWKIYYHNVITYLSNGKLDSFKAVNTNLSSNLPITITSRYNYDNFNRLTEVSVYLDTTYYYSRFFKDFNVQNKPTLIYYSSKADSSFHYNYEYLNDSLVKRVILNRLSFGSSNSSGVFNGGDFFLLRSTIEYCGFPTVKFNPDQQLLSDVNLFPNPVLNTDWLHLSFTLNQLTQLNLIVSDLFGREVVKTYLGNVPSGNTEIPIDISGLPSGIFFVSLQSEGNKLSTQKFVVHR